MAATKNRKVGVLVLVKAVLRGRTEKVISIKAPTLEEVQRVYSRQRTHELMYGAKTKRQWDVVRARLKREIES